MVNSGQKIKVQRKKANYPLALYSELWAHLVLDVLVADVKSGPVFPTAPFQCCGYAGATADILLRH